MTTVASRQVLVVQRRLTHYRVPFFELLREDLRAAGVLLRLAHGDPTPEEATKRDSGALDWAQRLPTRYWLGGRVCWQPFFKAAEGADLTVVTAENKLVCNLAEQFGTAGRRVALWGHGGNLQGNARSLRERFKARVAMRADWWLAYTEMSRALVQSLGFPPERITVLNNAVDTTGLAAQFAAVQPQARESLRAELGLGDGPVGLYLGSLYAEKRIDWLLEAARCVRRQVPGFQLLVVGGGPQQAQVAEAAAREPWIKMLGTLKGADKVLAVSLADVYLHPGAVGLGVLDAFAAGLPMVTAADARHGPEYAYLQPGRNSLVTSGGLPDFADACLALLRNSTLRNQLARNCRDDAKRYTLAEMSTNFTRGVVGALAAPIRRGVRSAT